MPTPITSRQLLITADDFGIGPETSHGILELAHRGAITSTVLLVNSPHAANGVEAWRKAGRPLELGWHPCLTLDQPILPPTVVPSLVTGEGRFHMLGELLKRLLRGRIREAEIEAEFHAQCHRFLELVGEAPKNVNAHHHIHIFPSVGRSLRSVLKEISPNCFVRRVSETSRTLVRVPGARLKRMVLSHFGNRSSRIQEAEGFSGCDTVIGITDPHFVKDEAFFTRWLAQAQGQVVELACHPGRFDPTLIGRDGTLEDGQLHRRTNEYELLNRDSFQSAIREAGFSLVTAAKISGDRLLRAA